MFSRARIDTDAPLVNIFSQIATDDAAFRMPDSNAKTLAGILADMAPTLSVDEFVGEGDLEDAAAPVDRAWHITSPSGEQASVYRNNRNKEIWLDISNLKEGRTGSGVYQAVATLAHNTGHVFIGDPAGLSDKALYRRTEHMISSALRHGTTKHLAPHARQVEATGTAGGADVRPIDWQDGDDAHNLQEMLVSSYTNILHLFPEIADVTYNFARARFERAPVRASAGPLRADQSDLGEWSDEQGLGPAYGGSTSGRGTDRADEGARDVGRVDAVPFTNEDFVTAAESVRNAYDVFFPTARGMYTPPIGMSDIKRAVLTQSVLQEAGRDGGREVLDHVSERLLQRVSPQLARLLYSRDAEYFRADGVSSLPTLPPGADAGTTAPLELSGVDFLRAMKATEQLNRELAKADMAPVRALRTAPNAQFALARQVGKALGIEVNFVRKNAEFEGVAYNGVAYLTEGMRNAELAIAGHETLHALEQSNPELGAKLRTQIRAYLKEGVVEDRQAREFAANGFQDVTEDQAEAEVIADINGRMWMDPVFWSDLAKADRALFRSVAYKFMEVAAKLIKSLRGSRFDVAALVRDVDAVRAIMVATWAENNATRDAAAPAPVVRRAMRETSVALPRAKWLADEAIAKEVENRIGKFEHQPVVRIRDSAFGVLPGVASDEHVSGAVYEGVIYLFRDALPTLREVQRTLFHEMLHYGLQRFLPGDEYITRMNMIYQRDGAFRAEADRWVKTGQGQLALKQGGQKYATARGIDEALAVLAEPNAGAFTRTDVRAKVERTVQRWLANLAEWLGMPEAAAYWRGMKNEEARALIQQIFRKTATDFPPADPWAAAGSAALRKGKKALGEAAAPGGSPAFKAWFGNSQVVGPAGEPQVVYHGTDSDFDAFTPSQRGTFGTGVYFAAARDEADAYGERTVEAYLSLQNPWQIDVEHDSDGSVEEDFDSPSVEAILSLPAGRDLLDEAKNGDGMYGLALQAQLKRLGHDGIIATYSDGSREYVAFSPTQVKSATDNNGDFNPADPRIAFSRSGLGDALASAANSIAEVRLPANYLIGDLFNSTGKLSWWHKSIGTMDNLAKRQPAFAAVYGAVQRFLGDVSRYAVVAADLAPTLLPKLENVADIVGKNRKKALTAADTKAIGAPIFEGTLTWARDAHGKPVKIEDLEEQAEAMSTADKARILLKKGIIDDQQNRAWQHNPLDLYDSIINSRFKDTQLRAGVVWSDAELRSMFGLSADQAALYRQFRAALDKSLMNLTVSEMVKLGGKDANGMLEQAVAAPDLPAAAALLRDHFIALAKLDPEKMDMHLDTARQIMNLSDKGKDLMDRGYAPLSRFGKHTVYVQEGEDQVYFGMFETQYEASKMARDMRAEHPGAQVSHGTVSADAYKLFAGVSPETIELFGSMVGLDSQASAASTEVYQTYLKLAKNNRSSMKRMIQRKGIAGFSEDAGRVLAGFIYSNARLTAGNAHLGEIDEAITEIPKQQGELTDAAMQLREHIRNPEAGAPLGGLMFAQFLGGSVASAMVNLTQPFTMTLPYLSQFGGLTKAGARLAAAVKDATGEVTGDTQLDAAMRWATEEGIVAPQEVHYLQAQASGKGALRAGDGTTAGNTRAHLNNAMAKVTLGWGKLFAMAELANRRITFIAAYRTAVDEGFADPAKFAQEAVAQTQGIYNSGNKPKWTRGVVGSLLMTFKQYSIGYLELLSRMAFAGAPGSKERAAGRRAALYMLAVLLLMGGADGLPFEQDLEDAIDGILQRLGYNFSSKRSKQAFLTDTLGQGGADFVLKGVSSMPGMPVDVAGRFGMGNLIPGTGLLTKKDSYARDLGELAGPAGDIAKRAFTGAGKLLGGDVAGAVLDVTPAAVRNVAKGADMLATGAYRDARGYNVNDNSAAEAVMKMVGFQPNSTADIQDAKGQALNMVGQNRMRSMEIAEHWAQGLADSDMTKVDEARAWRDDWNAKNPATPIRVSMPGVIRRVQAMRQDALNRTQKTAPAALKQTVRRELAETRAE
ncbi:PLxRFG domain-containing protein [Massilia sp. H27-R4]|nr:PLxRFG domain-containing protein [Massilia sp. H27-R4]